MYRDGLRQGKLVVHEVEKVISVKRLRLTALDLAGKLGGLPPIQAKAL